MEPTAQLLSEFFCENYGADRCAIKVTRLGSGSHGQGFLVEFSVGGTGRRLIVKRLEGGIGLGHDYPSDRAGVFLLAMDSYGRLPRHVRAVDVLSYGRGKGVISVSGGSEYYLVMQEAAGESYFNDLDGMRGKAGLDSADRARIKALAKYLAGLHTKKKDSPALYYRKIRDTIGHGECLMGVLDTYSGANFTNLAEMAAIEKSCVDWRARLKPLSGRLARVHGDFHPGNIFFNGPVRFTLLDRSRGEYGEPADDTTALSINYVFFSLIHHGRMSGAYKEAISLFHDEYLTATGDRAVLDVSGLFFAFRGVVVANPLFYPDVSDDVRDMLFAFVHGVLASERFEPGAVDDYISAGMKYRRRFK
jgi:Phosphotransferase enzyme family